MRDLFFAFLVLGSGACQACGGSEDVEQSQAGAPAVTPTSTICYDVLNSQRTGILVECFATKVIGSRTVVLTPPLSITPLP